MFFGQVECHRRRRGDGSTAEIQTPPDVGGHDPEPDVAVDIGRRKRVLGDEAPKLRLRDIPIYLMSWQEPRVNRFGCAYSRSQKRFVLQHIGDLPRVRSVKRDGGPPSKSRREILQALERSGLPQPGPVGWIDRSRLFA